MEEALGTFGELFLKGESVFEFGLGKGIDNTATLEVGTDFGFHFGNFPTQVVKSGFGFHGIHKHGDIERVVEVDERGEPVGVDETGVAGDEEGAEERAVGLHGVEINVDVVGRNEIFDGFSFLEVFGRRGHRRVFRRRF